MFSKENGVEMLAHGKWKQVHIILAQSFAFLLRFLSKIVISFLEGGKLIVHILWLVSRFSHDRLCV